ncbi:MAG: hypothetical protein IJD92_04045 [Bacilli bacterium]|nr:hypothetical protein [Bacilli bacterium]
MIKAGDLVYQEKTMVNGINCKDNKNNRLSVVLFSFFNNDTEYICSCPITNHVINFRKVDPNFLYIPYQILSDKKLCAVKLDSAFIYPINEISETGLSLNNKVLLKLYDAILNLDNNYNIDHYRFIKDNLRSLSNEIEFEEKAKLKEEIKLRKQLRKERKRNYKKCHE